MATQKDKITLYMFRNAFSTLVIAFVSFMISLISYYECSFVEAVQRLFLVNIYTTLYFLLLWLLDYMIFEISKIIYDTYESILTYKLCLILCIIAVIIYCVPMMDLFQWNFIFLCLFIALRQVKQLWIHKKRP
ncbi:hypothetical protein NMU03_16440 [Allocoprobacillus halotolerans]|uniref:Uncharacterized protein n=1 Tax=Allocoprobacillus halotolerans TaxID=2944914 RepID=A0ABY5I507_9FIRM|nr:hypothetical protein [Allocoprobacillus halotolerans]UTY39133.1 hypothetical protein NMU03_16440 [Allocoprobacillus halotolerans]